MKAIAKHAIVNCFK